MTEKEEEARFSGTPAEFAEFKRLVKKPSYTPQEVDRLRDLVQRFLHEDPSPLEFAYYVEPKLSTLAVLPEPFTAEDVAKAWDMPVCHALGFLQRWTGGWVMSEKQGYWTRTPGLFPTLETLRELRSQRDAARTEMQREARAAGRPCYKDRQREISFYPDDDRLRRVCEKAFSQAEQEEYNRLKTKAPWTSEEIARFNALCRKIEAYEWDHPDT